MTILYILYALSILYSAGIAYFAFLDDKPITLMFSDVVAMTFIILLPVVNIISTTVYLANYGMPKSLKALDFKVFEIK
jgi:hypothetical protein